MTYRLLRRAKIGGAISVDHGFHETSSRRDPSGRIKCSIRIWMHPRVKVGGRYRMEEGHIVVDSIVPIRLVDITDDLARESGFSDVKSLLATAKHGSGNNVYLVRFHYLPPGAWDAPQRSNADQIGEPAASRTQSSRDSRSQIASSYPYRDAGAIEKPKGDLTAPDQGPSRERVG